MRQFSRDERVIFSPSGTPEVYEARVLHQRGDGTVAISLHLPGSTPRREVAQTAELERCQVTPETQ